MPDRAGGDVSYTRIGLMLGVTGIVGSLLGWAANGIWNAADKSTTLTMQQAAVERDVAQTRLDYPIAIANAVRPLVERMDRKDTDDDRRRVAFEAWKTANERAVKDQADSVNSMKVDIGQIKTQVEFIVKAVTAPPVGAARR